MRAIERVRALRRRAQAAIFLIVFLGFPVTAASQIFDAARYGQQVRESNALYDQAQGEADESAKQELLIQSATLKHEALQMLRDALLAGELEAFGDQARQDLFNLRQNLIVVLCELDDCAEARTQLEEGLGDAAIMPEGAVGRLGAMQNPIDSCQTRVDAIAAVEVPPTPDTGTEEPDEPVPDEPVEPDEPVPAEPDAVAMATPDEPPDEPVDDEPVDDEPDGGGVNVVAISLIAGGAAIAIGGLVWDLALGGTRDDFEALQAQCEAGCDSATHARAEELQGDLDTGSIGTVLLYGLGGATAAVGIVLLVLSLGDDDEPPVAVSPLLGPDRVGAVVGFEF